MKQLSTISKKFFIYLILFFTYYSYSQEYKEYYIVEKTLGALSSQSKSLNADGSLSLIFQDTDFENYLASKKVYKYEKAFSGIMTDLLERTYIIQIDKQADLENLSHLSAVDFIEFIPEPLLLEHPNDFETSSLYPDGIQSSALDLVRAPFAWQVTKGDDPNVMIGIVDNTVNISHEDLADNIFLNVGTSTTNPSHGTRVAGYASAASDNGIGVASIGFNTKLVTSNGRTPRVHEIAQIPGVRVINTAWVSSCPNERRVDREVYRQVWEDFGVIVVSAASNGNLQNTCDGNPSTLVYPAAYQHTVSVSSVSSTYERVFMLEDSQGQFGALWNDLHEPDLRNPGVTHQHNAKVDLVAPGYDVPGNIDHDNGFYRYGTGTSYASPQVSAAVALILSVNTSLTPDEVKDILLSTTDDIYWIPQNQPYVGLLGSGRLNVFRAVKKSAMHDF
ncbi:S8 family peptidase [Psychroflexus tropicus]|uniref:S8 family peptidase n=1 Tax=Psychroflexus tropicus TaxID=197345 RepID=UPI0003680E31|nr:S8/S53 family peptidase [Psychroflexus tropicus]